MDNHEPRGGERAPEKPVKVRIRLDFKGSGRPGRLLFGGKSMEKSAEDAREQQVALFRNVPMQGIYIEDIDLSNDIFSVHDEAQGTDIAFAPVVLTVRADALEDIIPLITRRECRKIEVLEPEMFSLAKQDTERILFKIHRQLKMQIDNLERKYLK